MSNWPFEEQRARQFQSTVDQCRQAADFL